VRRLHCEVRLVRSMSRRLSEVSTPLAGAEARRTVATVRAETHILYLSLALFVIEELGCNTHFGEKYATSGLGVVNTAV